MKILVVACALFSMGLYGVLTRRDIVAVLASIEVMMGGAITLLVGLSASGVNVAARTEAVALLVLALAAAEAAVGLALLVLVAKRRGTTRIDELTEVKG